MTFKFPITLKDYIAVRVYEFFSTKGFKILILVERIAGVAVIAMVSYILRHDIQNQPAFILFLLASFGWVIGFPWVMKIRLGFHAKREIKESGEKILEGDSRISFGEFVIEQEMPGHIIRRVTYDNVDWVEDAKKYILIYDAVNPTPLIIPCVHVFESKEEQNKFVEDLRKDCGIETKSKKERIKNGPRLKVKKRK